MIRATVVRGARGSVLLSALVLIFVITTLGLALFELSFVESRSSFLSQSDARAFEIAQAGIERALERLLQTILSEPTTTASWADGDITVPTAICTGDCVDTVFRDAASLYISNTAFDGGSYAISFKLLTVAEASSNPYGQRCLEDTTTPTLCANLIFVRSTGTVAGLPGYSASRTIQLLAQAKPPFTGMTAGASSGGSIRGNVRIAGSLNVIGDPATASLSFGTNARQRNNWEALNNASLDRLTPLQPVCPPGRTCSCALPSPDSNCVYSLGATLRVALPTTIPAVVLSSNAHLGQSQADADNDGCYHTPCQRGKGPLDAIYVAEGCVMPCTDNFTGVTVNSNTFVDDENVTRPYPSNPTTPFPLLTDPVQISGDPPSSYIHYACSHGNTVPGCAVPSSSTRDPTSTNEFFLNHAYHVCSDSPVRPCADPDALLADSLGSVTPPTGPGLTDGSDPFRVPITFYNRSGVLTEGEICWRRRDLPAAERGGNLPPASQRHTLEFGIGWWSLDPNLGCGNPSTPQNPLLVYMNSDFTIAQGGSYYFRGAAIFLVTGVVKIEESWSSCWMGTGPACRDETFPERHLFAVLTPNRMEVAKNNNINAIFGLFYTASDFYSETNARIVGSITARRFCLGSGDCPLSSDNGVPRFFEVPYDPRTLPAEMFLGSPRRWTISPVLGFWLECRPGATPTVPATVTGICGYS